MENFLKLVFAFVIGFILVVIAMPKVIPFLHKMKFGQVEREEGLESHKVKNGTPTMGGIVFVLAAIIAAVIVNIGDLFNPEIILATIVLVGYSLIGFVDDALIIIKHSNKGLPPLAKLLAQIALAIICYFFAMNFIPGFTSVVTIPIVKVDIDFGILYPALILLMFAGTSNGVNLSDGLDGLATGLSMVAIAPFIIFATMTKDYALASYATAMVGALLGFMMFNYHPAKIFMGDVGSLGLGGFLAILAILTKQELLLILVGGVFIMETVSVIIQVVSFKTRGKRVFKMAPIHHHFEMLGWSEQQVTISFWFIGFICGILSIVIGVL
ncbi:MULTISPECIES: phospho-N-acetylmuramoyl-pentapeptide-transferase [unclassified Thomasclavelia]|uniref:Phospho-N-acetylmuramoyl-pentapeptide-transferase n=1 Tax=Candidatus Erysipelatoclostridium merdavium TaxID=2838566 RepID=A0A9D2BNY1_9FIRM|nr:MULTISPECIES: phospho-N-acetylmuramoyl-pentapeptide-transferase [unclassified Thomasclavelia]OUP78861.1 phospho-N-acetylmuramoyl-pentapeptide-transferase [Erysipelatoclostridium sp. An173]WRK53953.1 phospho-N-acetylmuramoyl-pentapeptide-transferase [Coprobacillaceae bacterium CR2/5/TPMF4]HIX82199.1 phospho-N-acetylmuramoyl-pentapeptide-transferase [Candidatus Erysipelatoclostridium merdavium]